MQPYNQNNDQQQINSQLPTIEQFFKNIPFFCRCIYFGMFFFWIFNIFTLIPENYMQSHLHDSIMHYQIWRIFVCFLFQPYFLMTILCILNYQTFLPLLEYKKCTTFLLINFVSQNIIIQLLACLLEYIYYLIFSQFYMSTNGAAGVWFNYMTKFCLYNPNLMKFCCFNFKFNRKYFPFLYFGILSLYYWQIRTDMIAGIILALIQKISFMQNRKFCFQLKHYEYIEQMMSKIKVTSFECWVSFQAVKILQPLCTKIMYTNLESQMNKLLKQNQLQRSSTSVNSKGSPDNHLDPFSGKQGIRLGDY